MILPRRTRRFEHRSDWKQRVEPEKGKRAGKVKLERAQGDALALGAEEGRSDLRKATGSRKQAVIRGYPNGETRPESCPVTIR